MNLYKIDEQMRELLDMIEIDEETGEIVHDLIYEELQSLSLERDQKLEGFGVYIKELDAEFNALKTEYQIIKQRMDSIAKKRDSLSDYVRNYLIGNEISKFETPKVKLSLRKSDRVEAVIDDVPKKYFKKIVDYKLDKAGIRELLKSGKSVKGCTLVTYQNLQIK